MKIIERIYDHRTVRKSIADGATKAEDYNKFLKSLPDETDQAEEVPYEDENDLDIPLEITEEPLPPE